MNLNKAGYSIALCLLFTCGVQSFALFYIFTNSTNHSVFVCIRAELSLCQVGSLYQFVAVLGQAVLVNDHYSG